MTYLPNLLKKIDNFCSLTDRLETMAQDYSSGYSSPDEPEEESVDEEGDNPPHYDELMNLSRQVDDPELSQQLQTLAELYRYAIQLGGGYSTIAMAINNLKTMYGDGSDSDIEDTLNGMIRELAKAAGGIKALSGKDNPSFVQRLVQLKQDIEARNQEERSGALDAYQEEISGKGSGAQTDETSQELAEAGLTPEQADIVNPAALGFADKEDPKTNKGWHTTGSGKAYKNWKEYYNNERVSYEADLVDETDPDIRQTLEQLIKLLPTISDTTQQALDLSNALRSDVDKPEEQARVRGALDESNAQLQRLKYVRRGLRNRIRNIQLQKEKQKISSELQDASQKYETSADPERKEKFRRETEALKQKLALNELSQSTDVYKAKERNYRLEMLRQMSGGAFPAKDWIEKQQQKIDAAAKQRKSKVAYDREQSVLRGQEHGKIGPVPERQKGRRGGGRADEKLNQYNIEKATFGGLLDKLGEKIGTAAHVARLNVTQEKNKLHNSLKPLVEIIGKTIQNSNKIKDKLRTENNPASRDRLNQLWTTENKAKYDAIRNLKAQMKEWAARAVAIKALERNVRWLPHFKKNQLDLESIAGWKTDQGWQLDGDKATRVAEIINNSTRLLDRYDRTYGDVARKAITPGAPMPLEISFDSAVQYMKTVIAVLCKETGIYPNSAEASFDLDSGSNKNRIKILSKILTSQQLFKLAQEAETTDPTQANQIAEEIFDRLFEEVLQETGLKEALTAQ